jgi:hypothetical protein
MMFPALQPDAAIGILTPSYRGDLERCRLLCDTLDQAGGDGWTHLILVADEDLALFRPLEGRRRQVIQDSAYFPAWLKLVRMPFSHRPRWLGLSPGKLVWPMSGWHIQQIRKLLAARISEADLFLMADSDTVFIRPVTHRFLIRDGAARLYVKPGGISGAFPAQQKHRGWLGASATLLGLPPVALPADDYINNLVTWRRDALAALVEHIEAVTGRELPQALGRHRSFSEYLLYGQFIDRVHKGASGHWRSDLSLGHTYWSGAALDEGGLERFVEEMDEGQIAFGVQSFTETPVDLIRRWIATRLKPSGPATIAP